MGICGTAFETVLSKVTPKRTETRIIKVNAKCPDCGKEFVVDVTVEQQIAGFIKDFNAFSGGGILSQCPWTKK